jgi:hypothetical protein
MANIFDTWIYLISLVFWVFNVAKSKFVLILDYVLRRLQHDYFHHNS